MQAHAGPGCRVARSWAVCRDGMHASRLQLHGWHVHLLLVPTVHIPGPASDVQRCLCLTGCTDSHVQGVYRAYSANSKFVNAASMPQIHFMAAAVIEMYGINAGAGQGQQHVSHRSGAAREQGGRLEVPAAGWNVAW